MTEEKVIGFGSGVVEPQGFGEGEIATERDLGVVERLVRDHRRRRLRKETLEREIAGGGRGERENDV